MRTADWSILAQLAANRHICRYWLIWIHRHLNLPTRCGNASERAGGELHLLESAAGAARLHADIEGTTIRLFPGLQGVASQLGDVSQKVFRGSLGGL